jgi:hypothetical protein
METIIETLSKEFDLIAGGIIVAGVVLPLFNSLKRIIVEEWHDLVGFGLAVIICVLYGFLRQSAFAGLESLAGSQLFFALVKKGLLPVFKSK